MSIVNIKGADFSECGLYRYSLWRIWDEKKPLVMFIGLNPSTANAEEDDPTIRRVKAIAANLGYGGVYMCNCFSYISTNPKMLQAETLEAMMRNAEIIKRVAESCKCIIFAWGNFDIVKKRGVDKLLSEAFPLARALYINKNGSPKHPLYCKADIKPVMYKWPEGYKIIHGKNPNRVHESYWQYIDEFNAQYNMLLPDGLTCDDCVNRKRCSIMYDQKLTHTSCQWYPSRFTNLKDL